MPENPRPINDVVITRFPDGSPKTASTYVDGQRLGPYTEWDAAGEVVTSGTYTPTGFEEAPPVSKGLRIKDFRRIWPEGESAQEMTLEEKGDLLKTILFQDLLSEADGGDLSPGRIGPRAWEYAKEWTSPRYWNWAGAPVSAAELAAGALKLVVKEPAPMNPPETPADDIERIVITSAEVALEPTVAEDLDRLASLVDEGAVDPERLSTELTDRAEARASRATPPKGRPVPVYLRHETIARADDLVEWLAERPLLRAWGRGSRNAVLRVAILRGLATLEQDRAAGKG